MNTWDRLEGETSLAYEWFCRYRDMGPDRSMTKVVQSCNKGATYKGQLAKWSLKFDWVSRVMAYDQYMEGQKRLNFEDEQMKAIREQVQLSNQVMEVLLRHLVLIDGMRISPLQWKGLAEFAVKTKRDALGFADKVEMTGQIDVRDENAVKICDEILGRTERLLATRGIPDDPT